jgi:hypothetical protein
MFFFSSKVVSGRLLDVFCVSRFVLLICLLCLVCYFLIYPFFSFKVASGRLLDLFCVSRFVLADVFSLLHVC